MEEQKDFRDESIGETNEPDSKFVDSGDAGTDAAPNTVCRWKGRVYSIGGRICENHVVFVCTSGGWSATNPVEHC